MKQYNKTYLPDEIIYNGSTYKAAAGITSAMIANNTSLKTIETRALIDRNWQRMGKSVEMTEKAEQHESKAEYWESKINTINLSMPESVEYYEYKVETAKEYHEGVKSGKYPRSHSFTLTYAKKALNEAANNLKTAKKLWA